MNKASMRHLARYVLSPVLFLTVALIAGIRFQAQTSGFQFIYPPLVSCIVGALATVLLIRCGLFRTTQPDSEDQGVLDGISRLVLISCAYLATVQVFNCVTPERGLLSVFFNIFYLLILLNDLFVVFNPKKLAGALATILGASFLLKYLLLSDLFAPASSWGKYLLQEFVKAGSLGALDQEPFAPATGYLALSAVGLYVVGLYLIAPIVSRTDAVLYKILTHRYALTHSERIQLLTTVAGFDTAAAPFDGHFRGADPQSDSTELTIKARASLPPA